MGMNNFKKGTKKFFRKSLDWIEIIGNRLPHPATIFAMLAGIVLVISAVSYWANVSAVHPVDGTVVTVKNLLSGDGIRWIYTNILDNFLMFPPLGYVLIVMIGIGLAEGTGLFAS